MISIVGFINLYVTLMTRFSIDHIINMKKHELYVTIIYLQIIIINSWQNYDDHQVETSYNCK